MPRSCLRIFRHFMAAVTRRWHPRDPRRTAPRPPGPRHARPLRPRLSPDARRPQASPPGPLGRLPPCARHDQPALTGSAARRTPGPVSREDPAASTGTTSDTTTDTGTGGQREDDLPNSSQTAGRPHPRHSGESLSYEPLTWPDTRNRGVELRGLEPRTPCLQSKCSSS